MIGLGFMGSTHLKAFRNIPVAELVAVASNDQHQLTGDLTGVQGNIGAPGDKLDFSGVRKYTDALEAAHDPEAEAVDICLPTNMHAPVAIEALRRGKHVLVEKPLALDGESADLIVAEAEKQGKILMTAQVLRFWPAYVVLAELLKNRGLGSIYSAMFRRRCAASMRSGWIADPRTSGGGVFDLLIHDVDMCLHLFGVPEAVSAWGHEDMPRGIDVITAQLHYSNIPSVTVTGGWHHPKSHPFSMECTIVTDGGTLEFNSVGCPPTLYDKSGEMRALPLPGEDGYTSEIRYFLDCASAGRAPALCPPRESAAAVKLTGMIVDSRNCRGEKLACTL